MAKSQVYKALALLGVLSISLSIAFTNCAPAFQVLPSSTQLASSGGADPTVELKFDLTTPDLLNEAAPKSISYSVTSSNPSSDYVMKCYLNSVLLTSCSSPLSLAAVEDGDATVRVVALSKNGTLLSEISRTFRIDRKPPTINIVARPSAQTSSTTATIQYSVSDQFSSVDEITVQCLIDAGAYAACTSPRNFPVLATGPHVIKLKATDKAGNTSPETEISFAIVVGLPTVNITQAPNPFINTTSATFAFTGASTDSTIVGFECSIDNGVTYAACTSPKTYSDLINKTYGFAVRAKDAVNQLSGVATRNFTVDTVAPSVPMVTSNLTGPTKTTSLNLSFSAMDLSGITSYQCAQDTGAFTACTSPRVYTGLTSGTRVFRVKAIDQAGNSSPEGMISIVIDTVAPVVNITGMPNSPTTDSSAAFTFTATDAGSGINVTECKLDTEASYSTCASPKNYTGLPIGGRVFNVRVSDGAGNSTIKTYAWTVAAMATPTPTPPPTPTPAPTPGGSAPQIGAHAIGVDYIGEPGTANVPYIDTAPFNTVSGSLIVVSVGRGIFEDFSFSHVYDNKGNGNYTSLGGHTYTKWPGSGTAVFTKAGAAGGMNHIVTAGKSRPGDEVTIIAAEVRNVSRVVDSKWIESPNSPNTSATVTTNGPAVLVAFWWGDDIGGELMPAVSAGWTLLDRSGFYAIGGGHVQGASASRTVTEAGTYSITWTPTTAQGAQLWILVLQ